MVNPLFPRHYSQIWSGEKLEKKICEFYNSQESFQCLNFSQMTTGIPDLLVIPPKPDFPFFIECKNYRSKNTLDSAICKYLKGQKSQLSSFLKINLPIYLFFNLKYDLEVIKVCNLKNYQKT